MSTTAPARPRTLPCTAEQVVSWALTQVGTTEKPYGSNSTPYGREYGMDRVAWCAIFVWSGFKHAGVDLRSVLGGGVEYTPRFAQLCKAAGWSVVPADQARAGDIVFCDFPGDDKPRIQHVGIVRAFRIVSGHRHLLTIEGNTSARSQDNGGAVECKERGLNVVALVVRPPYAPTPSHAQAQRYTLHRTLKVRRWRYLRGNDVKAVQRLVGAHIDGVYGPATARAVAVWQHRVHETPDGEFGPQSARAAGWNYAS